MRRLALRYYLPIVQIVFLLGLLAADQAERYEAAHQPQEKVGWDLRSTRPNIYAEAFGALNAPAFMGILPVMLILPGEPEWPFALVLVFAMLLFWFGVGRFFDRLRGVIHSPPFYQRGKLWRASCWLALFAAGVALGIGVLLLATDKSETAVFAFPLIIWPGLGGLILISELRRWHDPNKLNFLTLRSQKGISPPNPQ